MVPAAILCYRDDTGKSVAEKLAAKAKIFPTRPVLGTFLVMFAIMNVSYFADKLPAPYRGLLDLLVQLLMALIALFMIIWGMQLVEVTWYNTIADFPFLSVGITYLPIPIGGVCLLLFIVERIFLGAPSDPLSQTSEVVPFD